MEEGSVHGFPAFYQISQMEKNSICPSAYMSRYAHRITWLILMFSFYISQNFSNKINQLASPFYQKIYKTSGMQS